MSVNQRIKFLMNFDNKTQTTFANKLGIKQSTLSTSFSKDSAPHYATTVCILNAYPKLRPEWLLLGEEPMWKEQVTNYEQRIKELEQRIKELEQQVSLYQMFIKAKLPDVAKELNL